MPGVRRQCEQVALNASERTIPVLLERAAARFSERPCLSIGSSDLSYGEILELARGYGGSLDAAGVEPGDRVAVMAENCIELLSLWLGCAWRSAIFVPINTASRGEQLAHVLLNAGPRVLAAQPEFAPALAEISEPPAELQGLWSIGGTLETPWHGVEVEPFPAAGDRVDPAQVGPGDTLAILYTSGTTGPSKGVMCPHAQFTWWGENVGGWLGVSPTDTLHTCLPLFHTNALNGFVQALMHGARYVVGPRFSASRFVERLVDAEATVTYLLGAMVSILMAQPASSHDREHSVRIALAPGTSAETWHAFEERFGITVVEGHGMTETNAVIGPRDGQQRPGWMGRVMPGFDVRVVDEHDLDVAPGTPGELVMRSDDPFAFATGYWRLPEATAAASRNLWFHSGDRVVRDEDGYMRFVDRLKDVIRRRGENISGWEVEQALLRHGDIEAVAVIPVPSELGEDEVMACLVPRTGTVVDPVELIRFCEPLLAYFAIPRYLDFLEELPLTENGKVRKVLLRERGITASAWDREAAGVELRR